jgi:hypothetical protein
VFDMELKLLHSLTRCSSIHLRRRTGHVYRPMKLFTDLVGAAQRMVTLRCQSQSARHCWNMGKCEYNHI